MDTKPGTKVESKYPDHVKIWSVPGLSAITGKHGGAWRVWCLAHVIDTKGSGRVMRSALFDYLEYLRVDDRQRRRWLADALALGLVREDRKGFYYLVSLGRAALLLGAVHVGRPAFVKAEGLVSKGWRSLVWSAYESSLGADAVISQETKYRITGISPRTQRNYHKGRPGRSIHNFVYRGKATSQKAGALYAAGVREVSSRAYFITGGGSILQRLPDSRFVPLRVAKPGNKGRSKKAQELLNFSLYGVREPKVDLRLFYTGKDSKVRAAIKRLSDVFERPEELYQRLTKGRKIRKWQPVEVCLGV